MAPSALQPQIQRPAWGKLGFPPLQLLLHGAAEGIGESHTPDELKPH